MCKRIYGAAVIAHKDFTVSAHPLAIRAHSEEEAIGMALKFAFDLWPRADGWDAHQATAAKAPDDWYEMKPAPTTGTKE